MRPWQHARSSALTGSLSWKEYLPVHEFIDSTKETCANRKHRIVLHHSDLGADLAKMAFPGRKDIDAIVSQHVIEDLGHSVTLSDWLFFCRLDELPMPATRRLNNGTSHVVNMVSSRANIPEDFTKEVFDILTMPGYYYPSFPEASWSVLMNAYGPRLIRIIFGEPKEHYIDGKNKIIDYGWLAEAVIFALYGSIPDLSELVKCCEGEPRR